MEKTFNIGNYIFKKSSYFVMKDGKVYRNVSAGLIEDPMRTTRKANGYKIHADHFSCASPYTNYYILDSKNNSIYVSKDNWLGNVNELASLMNGMSNLEQLFEEFNK